MLGKLELGVGLLRYQCEPRIKVGHSKLGAARACHFAQQQAFYGVAPGCAQHLGMSAAFRRREGGGPLWCSTDGRQLSIKNVGALTEGVYLDRFKYN